MPGAPLKEKRYKGHSPALKIKVVMSKVGLTELGTRWPFTGVSWALWPERPKKSEKKSPGAATQESGKSLEKVFSPGPVNGQRVRNH